MLCGVVGFGVVWSNFVCGCVGSAYLVFWFVMVDVVLVVVEIEDSTSHVYGMSRCWLPSNIN